MELPLPDLAEADDVDLNNYIAAKVTPLPQERLFKEPGIQKAN